MRHLLSLCVVSALLLAGTEAHATADPPPKRTYYGWQNMIVGYTGLGLMAHGYFAGSNAVMITGASTFALGGSFVHAAHGNVPAAIASPFLTAGIPLATVAVSGATEDSVLALGVLYALTAPVVDGLLGRVVDDPDFPVFTRVGVGVARFRARHPAAGDGMLAATTQFGMGLELSVGARIQQVVVAATLLEHIVAFQQPGFARVAPLTGDTSFTLATIGPTIEWHPQRRGGAFVGGTLGIAHFARQTDDAPVGAALVVHAGYDFATSARSSVGLALRLLYASMRTDEYGGSRVQAFTPALMVSYAYR